MFTIDKSIKTVTLSLVALSSATITGFYSASAQAFTLELDNNSQTISIPTNGTVITFSGTISDAAPFTILGTDITEFPGLTVDNSPELLSFINNETETSNFSGDLFTVSFTQNFNPGTVFNGAFAIGVNGVEGFDIEAETWSITVVPEPLTLLGVGTAVGFSAFFKRQASKKKLR